MIIEHLGKICADFKTCEIRKAAAGNGRTAFAKIGENEFKINQLGIVDRLQLIARVSSIAGQSADALQGFEELSSVAGADKSDAVKIGYKVLPAIIKALTNKSFVDLLVEQARGASVNSKGLELSLDSDAQLELTLGGDETQIISLGLIALELNCANFFTQLKNSLGSSAARTQG
jgi:hypothetical protein